MSCKVEILGKGKKLSSASDEQKIALAACRKEKKLALKNKHYALRKRNLRT